MKLNDLVLEVPYLELDDIFYDKTTPSPLRNPYLLSVSPDAAELIGLELDAAGKEQLTQIVNGASLLEGSEAFSMCYAGHQFGHFVPRLGDGRAINLGKVNGWNLQLKGAGDTLYSRRGDGRAVLRSSIREYLMSEAMYALGIPTTRALAIIGSDERVARERMERGSVVMRMSPSWVRFGTFEYFYYADMHEKLEPLADYVLAESYPHLSGQKDAYFLMYEEVVGKTALLVAQWQSVGFNHGVMNTDNMSIAGLTIDYGPYAFLDDYDFEFICNHTDIEGRYSFGSQPPVAYWNLSMLARALSPIVNIERMNSALEEFGDLFTQAYMKIMRKKLGLRTEKESDLDLLKWLLSVLMQGQVDYTVFFRALSRYNGDQTPLLNICIDRSRMSEWLEAYDKRFEAEESVFKKRSKQMLRTNPKYILKNYMLQEAIDKAERDDNSGVEELFNLACNPFDEHPESERYARPTPHEHKNLKLSCSS